MTLTRIAIAVTALTLSTAGTALAQDAQGAASLNPLATTAAMAQGQRAPDPFNPLDRLILDVFSPQRSTTDSKPAPRPASAPAPTASAYADYLRQYNQYLAGYTRYQQQAASDAAAHSWTNVLQNISDSVIVADQAVGVYEHALETQALSQAIR
jgi:hypothetical protein